MLNLADIAGAGTTVQLSATNIQAKWVQFIVSGSGTVRIGQSTVTANFGLPIPSGGGLFLPWPGQLNPYGLGATYAYIPAGATLSVGYEPFN